MPDPDRSRWVKIEFYGLVPAGQVLAGVDRAEICATLIRAFGFTRIDGLTVAYARREPAQWQC